MKPYQRQASPRKPLQLSRRDLLLRGALLPGAVAMLPSPLAAALAPVDQVASRTEPIGTASSFLVRNRHRFLAAGSMDYFRCPHTEWRDRILKAKRAGLNTIMTYVAWNQHEPEPGRYVFTGRSDIARFLGLCAELDMLAFVRPGPFICDEFEMGGHPAWLLAQPGRELRAPSPATEPIVAGWLARLCAEIAPLQTTRGGPVALVQVENEYYYRERPGGTAYLKFLKDTLRQNGIDVPLTACGNGTELQIPELFETINGYGRDTPASFRKRHPDEPLLISEHYTDWMDVWTWPQTDYPKRQQLEQISLDALSQRAMLSYFCFAGGTNFGFNGSSTWKTDHSWVCTRYYAQGPLAEGGALTPNYFAAKSASLPVQQFESFFANSRDAAMPVQLEGPVTGRALRSDAGMFVFVLPLHPIVADQRFVDDEQDPQAMIEERPSRELESAAGTLLLPGGTRLPLAAGSVRALLLPFGFKVAPGCSIDYSNCTLLGRGGPTQKPVLLFWGESGRNGHVSINGSHQRFVFGRGPMQIDAGAATLLCLSAELADRSWFADDRVLIGPAFVGERQGAQHACMVDEETTEITSVETDGRIVTTPVEPAPVDELPGMPLQWKQIALQEPHASDEGWRAIGQPRSVEKLGAFQGYCWYRARIPASTQPRKSLLFTAMADRAHVWINGVYRGVVGRGHGAAPDILPVELDRHSVSVTLLLDNMGRSSEGSTMQRKGFLGPVYAGAAPLGLPVPALLPAQSPPQSRWQFKKYQMDSGTRARAFAAEWTIPQPPGQRVFLALRNCPQYAWISVDEVSLADHPGDNSLLDGFAASQWLLPASDRPQQLRIVFYGPEPDLELSVHLYAAEAAGELEDWKFRPWTAPKSSPAAGNAGEPCLWQTEFDRPALAPPLFFATQGLSKGQAYLNGDPIGRYWELGPQFSLYLPPDTLRDRNTLALVDEAGNNPARTTIFRDRNVPTRMVLR